MGARVVAHPDNGIYRRRLALYGVIGVPAVCGMGVLFIGAAGAGWFLPFALLAFAPALATLVMMGLRSSAARISVEGDVLSVRNAFGAEVYHSPVEFLTGLHPIVFGAPPFVPLPGRVVITSETTRPYVVDLRAWRDQDVERLGRRLRTVPAQEPQEIYSWRTLRRDFPGVRMRWAHVHPWTTLLLLTVLVTAYLFFYAALFH